MENEEFKIVPVAPPGPGPLVVAREPNVEMGDVGCLIFFLAAAAVGISITLVEDGSAPLRHVLSALVVWAIVLAAVNLAVYRSRRRRALEAAWEQAHRSRLQEWEWSRKKSAAEALRLSEAASKLRLSFGPTLRSMATLLDSANSALNAAEQDYSERAFGPFWDNIERMALDLAEFNASATTLRAGATEYQLVLKGKNHNFPDLSAELSHLPDPAPTVGRFRQVVRAAQRDFEFSTIWEHRRTRDVLIQGFGSLAEAIDGLGSTLVNSIANIRTSFIDTSRVMVAEQERMRFSFEEAIERWESLQGKG